jgi:hypothetical protein
MKIIEYIAYRGKRFVLEWYHDRRYRSPSLDYFNALTVDEKVKVLQLFKRMGDVGEIHDKTKFNYEGDHIYAFKPNADRFLCFFFKGKKIVITNAFRKKQPKLPLNEKYKALKYKVDYEVRVNGGDYYA